MSERVIFEDQRLKALSCEPIGGHSLMGGTGEGQSPPALSGRHTMREGRRCAEFPEETGHGSAPPALFEAIATQFSPNPLVHALEFEPACREAVAGKPSDCQGSCLVECRKRLLPSMLRRAGSAAPLLPWCRSPFCCSALIENDHLLLALKIWPFVRLNYYGLC